MVNFQNNVVDNYPLYEAFINLYYKFVNQREQSGGEILFHSEKLDIDRVLDDEIDIFYATYGDDLPRTVAYDRRNLIKILNQIYEAKGTENSIKLLFRLIYDEDIQITYPNDAVLKPSDGRWIHEQYFTAYKQGAGVHPSENARIVFSNEKGDFSIIVTGVEIIDYDLVRIRFSSLNKVYLPLDQIVFHTDGVTTFFKGKVVNSPQKLTILNPGKYWKKGKIIIIPGTVKDTVAVITKVGTNGTILDTEIIEYGIGHTDNQSSIISPFPRKPTSSMLNIDFELSSVDPLAVGAGHTDHPGFTYHHTIEVEDYVDGVIDSVSGLIAGYAYNSYYLSDYIENSYIGNIAFVVNTNKITSGEVGSDADIRTWNESRASLVYTHAPLVDMKGKYDDDRGQLSNQIIKLQDSYFYQAFSYLLESIQDPKDYKKMADIFHPAGTKRFSAYVKQINEDLVYSYSRAFLIDSIGFRDKQASNDDLHYYTLIKPFSELMAPFDAISTKGVIKPLFDIPEASYIRWYDMTKVVNDSITELDIWAKDVTKPFSHSTTESDIWTKDITKPFTDEFISSEQKILDLFKPKADSAPVDDINSKDVDKILLDSIAQTDEYRVLDYIKPFEETSLPTDSSVFGVSKSGLIDTVTIVSVDGNGTLSDYRYSFEGYDSELYAESYKAILFS
jgi:hypothetical protein